MKLYLLFLVLFSLFIFSVPSNIFYDAVATTRCLVKNKLAGTIASAYQSNDIRCSHYTCYRPIREYAYASYENFAESRLNNGDLMFLFVNISQVHKNLIKNPFGSFIIYFGNCSESNFNGMPYDPLACPRITFVGKFVLDSIETSPDPTKNLLTNPNFITFSERHLAAVSWLKYSGHHFNLWYFNIKQIHYIGGYGNLHYIGKINITTYRGTKPSENC